MAMVPQEKAINHDALGQRDTAQFWRTERYDSLECLSASFYRHRYAPHTHDTYVVGCIVAGCERFTVRGMLQRAGPGDICFINPDEVHDGEPEGPHYAYRMSYPTVALVRSLAIDLLGRNKTQAPYFRDTVVHDPQLAGLFARTHAGLQMNGTKLESDEAFVRALSMMFTRYSDYGITETRAGSRENGPVARATDYIDAHFDSDFGLADLASEAGLSRHYLIRAFRKQTGLTPHAYLTNRRVDAARTLLRNGLPPADIALQCGFYDQSHLNRVFKARIGVTPGEFRRQ